MLSHATHTPVVSVKRSIVLTSLMSVGDGSGTSRASLVMASSGVTPDSLPALSGMKGGEDAANALSLRRRRFRRRAGGLLGEIIVRGERVRREVEALRRDDHARIRAL